VAVLKSPHDDETRTIPPRLLVGRSPACGLQLNDRHVSGEHATISWTGKSWDVRDLGSRNGTYVDGARIEVGQNVRLIVGTRVAFGDSRNAWTIVDDSAPSIMAIHRTSGRVQGGQSDLLVLPNPDRPEVSIYSDAQGWWWKDSGDTEAESVEDRATVETSDGEWTILLPSVPEGTPLMEAQLSLDTVELVFRVSKNEERVEIFIVAQGVEKQLPPREHGYILLTLARARQEDAHLPVDQRGWRDRDDLERMLSLDSNALNVAIHRARQQMSAAGIQGAARLVEVRPRQRRIGIDRFRIQVRRPND